MKIVALTPTLPAPKHQTSLRATSLAPILVPKTAPAIRNLPHLLELWHLTSLDAPTVAVTWTLAFAWSAHVHLPAWLPIILALSAWSFYITDRLLDAYRDSRLATRRTQTLSLVPAFQSPVLQPRHHFHWNHRKPFLLIAISSVLIALNLVVRYMPLAAQTRNSVLALASLAYLTSVHTRPSLRIPKELLVAIVFTAACSLPVLARIEPPGSTSCLAIIPAVLTFVALAWLNCQAIETWESNAPTRFKFVIPQLAVALAATAATLATISALTHHPRPALLLASAAASSLLLALLHSLKPNLTPTTLRTAADLVLLTPLALLAIHSA